MILIHISEDWNVLTPEVVEGGESLSLDRKTLCGLEDSEMDCYTFKDRSGEWLDPPTCDSCNLLYLTVLSTRE